MVLRTGNKPGSGQVAVHILRGGVYDMGWQRSLPHTVLPTQTAATTLTHFHSLASVLGPRKALQTKLAVAAHSFQ